MGVKDDIAVPSQLRLSGARQRTRGTDVFDSIKRDILSCRLRPGQAIFQKEVGRLLQVSPPTARVALQVLAKEGLVRVVPSVGYVVEPVTLGDAREMYQMRALIEQTTMQEAALRMRRDDLAYLEGLLHQSMVQFDEQANTEEEMRMAWYESNLEFHVRIATVAGNQRLARALRGVMEEMFRLNFLSPVGAPEVSFSLAGHRKILDALRAGDGPLAARLALEHLSRGEQNLRTALEAGSDNANVPSAPLNIHQSDAVSRRV